MDNLPPWLEHTRLELLASKEWERASEAIYKIIQKRLGGHMFTDMPGDSQMRFMERSESAFREQCFSEFRDLCTLSNKLVSRDMAVHVDHMAGEHKELWGFRHPERSLMQVMSCGLCMHLSCGASGDNIHGCFCLFSSLRVLDSARPNRGKCGADNEAGFFAEDCTDLLWAAQDWQRNNSSRGLLPSPPSPPLHPTSFASSVRVSPTDVCKVWLRVCQVRHVAWAAVLKAQELEPSLDYVDDSGIGGEIEDERSPAFTQAMPPPFLLYYPLAFPSWPFYHHVRACVCMSVSVCLCVYLAGPLRGAQAAVPRQRQGHCF